MRICHICSLLIKPVTDVLDWILEKILFPPLNEVYLRFLNEKKIKFQNDWCLLFVVSACGLIWSN